MLLHLFPCLLAATAVISAVIYQRTNQDIYGVLAVSSSLVCLIWGFVVAHWLIHLLLLMVVLKFTTAQIALFKPRSSEKDYAYVAQRASQS